MHLFRIFAMNTKDLVTAVKAFNARLKVKNPSGEVAGVLRAKHIHNIDDSIAEVCGASLANMAVSHRIDAVVDQRTVSCPDDLPVVVAVGINYGQSKTGHTTATHMRPGIDALNKVLGGVRGRADPVPPRYHLVAWNLFPFLLRDPWAQYGLNSIEEALIVWRWGYLDWEKRTTNLVKLLSPCLVVFHGANNAVPYHGFDMVDLLRPIADPDYPRVIFCGNLSRVPSIIAGRTAVEIRPPLITRSHTHSVNDG